MTAYPTIPVLSEEAWMDRKACKGKTKEFLDLFFDEEREREAKRFCNTQCSVIDECLEYAFRTPGLMEWGICGGMNPAQRRTERRKRRAKTGRYAAA